MSVTTYQDRETWLAARQSTLGASEVAAALGESPFDSPFSVWARKTGQTSADDLSDAEFVEWGNRLEAPIAAAVTDRHGRRVKHNDQFTVAHSESFPFLSATVDAVQFRADTEIELPATPGVLEIKTTNAFADWKDGPPLHVLIQLQTQLLVTEFAWGSVACLVGGQRLVGPFDYLANESFFESVVPQLRTFWRCVETKTAPAIDNHKATARAISKLFPFDKGGEIDLPDCASEWCRDLAEVKRRIKELELQKCGLENQIKDAIQDKSAGFCPGYQITYRTIERAGYSVEPTSYRQLRIKEV